MRVLGPSIAIPLTVLLLYFLWPGIKEQPWTALRIAGAIVAVIAYILVITARIQLGRSFSVRPEAKELVTHGLYSRLRHPMYIFVDLMGIGLTFALHLYWLLVIFAILVVFQVRQAQREAKILQEHFGQAYLEYRKRTWF